MEGSSKQGTIPANNGLDDLSYHLLMVGWDQSNDENSQLRKMVKNLEAQLAQQRNINKVLDVMLEIKEQQVSDASRKRKDH